MNLPEACEKYNQTVFDLGDIRDEQFVNCKHEHTEKVLSRIKEKNNQELRRETLKTIFNVGEIDV